VDRLPVDLKADFTRILLGIDLQQIGRLTLRVTLLDCRMRGPALGDLRRLLSISPLDEVCPVVSNQEVGVFLPIPIQRLAPEDEAVTLGVLQLLHLVKGGEGVEGAVHPVLLAVQDGGGAQG
jgi:hypothetical protein